MSTKYTLALVVGVVVVVGAVVATQWPREEPPSATSVPVPDAPQAAPAVTTPAATGSAPSAAPAEPAVQATAPSVARFVSSHDAQFRAATDYLEFSRAMLTKARAGDLDAQFHLYEALEYCRSGYRTFFDRGQKRHTLDEALRLAANGPRGDAQEIPKIHSRCQKLMESDVDELGEPEQWLQNAAQRKHPRAQAALAASLAARSPKLPAEQAARYQADARRLARESLASRDPAVIWEMASLSSVRADAASRNDLDSMAFARAACDRGLDCSAGSEPAAQWCRVVPDCQPYESVQDLLLRSSVSPAALEARAKQINELIDAGDWQALGFADPTPGP
jgi:hypothetical protein